MSMEEMDPVQPLEKWRGQRMVKVVCNYPFYLLWKIGGPAFSKRPWIIGMQDFQLIGHIEARAAILERLALLCARNRLYV